MHLFQLAVAVIRLDKTILSRLINYNDLNQTPQLYNDETDDPDNLQQKTLIESP